MNTVDQTREAQDSLGKLAAIGFRKVGEWKGNGAAITFSLQDCAGATNVLYAFVTGEAILYVGKTTMPLKRRMYGYQNPGPTQSTNIKANQLIRSVLEGSTRIEIYALPDNGLLHFGQFHLNLAAGLEDSIIADLRPEWNRTGKGLI